MKYAPAVLAALLLSSSPSWADDCKGVLTVETRPLDNGHIFERDTLTCSTNEQVIWTDKEIDPVAHKIIMWKRTDMGLAASGDYK